MLLPDTIAANGGLRLRCWQPEDAPALAAAIAASRAHLAPWMEFANQPPRSVSEHVARFTDWEQRRRSGGDGVYGMFLDGRVVGGCGLHRRLGPDGLEIGYWVHVDFTRRGLATAAAAALTDTAFADPEITCVEIHHDAANLASGAVPRTLGFVVAGESRRPPATPGESGLERRWRMTRQAWAARQLTAPPGAARG